MNNVRVAEQFLDKVCSVDNKVKEAIINKETRDYVINELSIRLESIVKDFAHLVDDIQERIIKYHSNVNDNDKKVTDFVQLVDWYGMSLPDKPFEYWDTNGKYYNLRMDEVINMFLMARFNV